MCPVRGLPVVNKHLRWYPLSVCKPVRCSKEALLSSTEKAATAPRISTPLSLTDTGKSTSHCPRWLVGGTLVHGVSSIFDDSDRDQHPFTVSSRQITGDVCTLGGCECESPWLRILNFLPGQEEGAHPWKQHPVEVGSLRGIHNKTQGIVCYRFHMGAVRPLQDGVNSQ